MYFVFPGDLAKSIRGRTNITFGLYHSLYEWFHPLYLKDKANGYKTREYVIVSNMLVTITGTNTVTNITSYHQHFSTSHFSDQQYHVP